VAAGVDFALSETFKDEIDKKVTSDLSSSSSVQFQELETALNFSLNAFSIYSHARWTVSNIPVRLRGEVTKLCRPII